MNKLLSLISFTVLMLWASSAIAQRVDLVEARRTVLDVSNHQLSTLESVVTRVPSHAQDKITEAIKANEASRNNALEALDLAQKGQITNEQGVTRAYDAVEHGTRKHTEVLTDLMEKVPEEARPAIERALEVSQTGRNTALSNLDAIKHGQRPSGAVEKTMGRPGTLPKPESTGRGTKMGGPGALPKEAGRPVFTGSGRKVESPYGGIGGKAGGIFGGTGGKFGGGGPAGFPGGGRPGR